MMFFDVFLLSLSFLFCNNTERAVSLWNFLSVGILKCVYFLFESLPLKTEKEMILSSFTNLWITTQYLMLRLSNKGMNSLHYVLRIALGVTWTRDDRLHTHVCNQCGAMGFFNKYLCKTSLCLCLSPP